MISPDITGYTLLKENQIPMVFSKYGTNMVNNILQRKLKKI